MAADWIKWQKGLLRKPEVIQIAARLGLSRREAGALLMEVWEWADENVYIDDSASGFDPDNCPGSVRLGDSPASLFDATFAVAGLADAMTAVGWMHVRSGSLVFPNFGRHNGKSAKARALDASRKRTERKQQAKIVRKPSGSEPDKSRTREEKRREEEIHLATASPPPAEVPAKPARKPSKKTTTPRPRNPLFDAVAEVAGMDGTTAAAGSLIGSVAASLAGADPPYTPDDVHTFAGRFHELCPYAAKDGRPRPTPKEIEKYIGGIRAKPLPRSQQGTRPQVLYDLPPVAPTGPLTVDFLPPKTKTPESTRVPETEPADW